MDIASKRHHPFITLPPEVRLQILGYLLPMNQYLVIRRDSSAQNIGQFRRLYASLSHRLKIPNYLLIDQQTTSQVLDIIYGCNTFTFNDPWLTETFMVRIGTANLHRINHIEVQAGHLTKPNNTTTKSTLFSVISDNFNGLQTLRVIGVGRGKMVNKAFDLKQWLPSHLERLEFLILLPGVLKNAKVYCDREEHNTRLLCNGAEYRTAWDEDEVDMTTARDEMKNGEKAAKKRKAAGETVSDMASEGVVTTGQSTNGERKKPKVKPHYGWKQ